MKTNVLKKVIVWSLIASLFMEATPVWALTKNETIYANINSDGSPKKTIVSEHISDNGNNILVDKSKLENIKNVNGKESFKKENKNIVWETNGKDIYYQGETKEQLPIELNVNYYLDDKEYDANDLIGKSGKIKIVINYKNNEKHNTIVNNKTEILYTPFVVTTTTLLSNADNKNISITNGKVIDNGTNSILVALAAPGLYDSLELHSLSNFDSTVIEYTTSSFELSTIYSVATSKLLDDEDLNIFNNVDKLYDSINELVNASSELVNGSEKLLDGANKIKNGTNSLKEGINSAYNGSNTMNKKVKSSIDSLSKDKSPALDDNTINGIVKSAEDSAVLSDKEKTAIGNQAIEMVKSNDTYRSLNTNYSKYIDLATQASNAATKYMEAYQQYNAAGDENTANEYLSKANEYKTQAEQAKDAATTYKSMMVLMEETAKNTAISTASATAKQVASKVAGEVAPKVANQVKAVATGKTISSLNTLSIGLEQLTDGLDKLKDGADTLYDGTNSLTKGIETLSTGLEKFDSEGIKKINSFVNGDVKDIEGKIEALINLSNAYNTFDDINDGDHGNSKIIFIIDSVKKEKVKDNNSKIATVEKKSLWQKIKGLFK
jgi:putative membrane protein